MRANYNFGSTMTLVEYFAAHPIRGERKRLQVRAEVTYETIRRILRGGRVRDVKVARRISRATGRAVPVWLLMGLTKRDLAEAAPRTKKN